MSARGPGDFLASFGQGLGFVAVGAVIFLLVAAFVLWRLFSVFPH